MNGTLVQIVLHTHFSHLDIIIISQSTWENEQKIMIVDLRLYHRFYRVYMLLSFHKLSFLSVFLFSDLW